jgi:hypothetical protein
MHLLSASLFLFVLGIQGIQFEPSTVEVVVSEIKDRYSAYIDFNGTAGHSAATTANETEATILPRAAPYWYESIAHQGISAFGPSGYAVYRNVKDYGATGTSHVFSSLPILKERRQRRYRRHCCYQCCYQCWRSLWTRMLIQLHHARSRLFPCRDLPYFILHRRLLLHPAYRKSQLAAGAKGNLFLRGIWTHRW